jgi:hypothetical protein
LIKPFLPKSGDSHKPIITMKLLSNHEAPASTCSSIGLLRDPVVFLNRYSGTELNWCYPNSMAGTEQHGNPFHKTIFDEKDTVPNVSILIHSPHHVVVSRKPVRCRA